MKRRTGLSMSLACVLALVVAVAGCGSTAKPTASPTPRPTATPTPVPTSSFPEPSTTPFAKSSQLGTNLAGLARASGKIQGTLLEGTESRKLSGTIAFKGPDSSIDLIEGGVTDAHRDEIVVAGKRYLRIDDGPWVSQGAKPSGTGLLATLKAAGSGADEGIRQLGTKSYHRIVSVGNTVDVAGALGLETWNWTEVNSRLRIWADDAGKPVGFGATLTWSEPIAGLATFCDLEIDVLFDASPKVSIAAPKGAWKWIVDTDREISFAVPAAWATDTIEAMPDAGAYLGKGQGEFAYQRLQTGGAALELLADSLVKGAGIEPDSRSYCAAGGRRAICLLTSVPTSKVFMIETLAVQGGWAYVLVFYGSQTQKVANQKLNDEIVATVEITG
jgi:hypothetical protein